MASASRRREGGRPAWRRWARCTRGGIVVWFALALPPLAVMTVGAVELASIHADKTQLQDVADAAALAGARELAFTGPNGVVERTQALALSEAADVGRRQRVNANVSLRDDSAVHVRLTAHRMSFFGNLLPPGGFNTAVVATASSLGNTPLCVVALQQSGAVLQLQNSARIQATGCLISGNRDLETAGGTTLSATEVQVAGVSRGGGSVNPAALTGAPLAEDPFASRHADMEAVLSGCSSANGSQHEADDGVRNLNPGAYRGELKAAEDGTLRLNPGVYVFCNGGRLTMDEDGRLEGNGVVIFVQRGFRFEIEDDEDQAIELFGMRTGPWAGLVLVAPPSNTSGIVMNSRTWQRLEGVIYMPTSQLTVEGSAQAAQESNWTISVTNRLLVRGSPTLVINSDYDASTVPVPGGVGARDAGVRLAQ